jgi:hypothetical protein
MNAAEFKPMSFAARTRSMLSLDFYRLFHTPALYIMLAVSAIIPAMVLSMTGVDTGGAVSSAPALTNTWQIVETLPGGASGDFSDFGTFANINMVFIFAGLLLSIFVAHDYSSGFVKNIFTVHAKKLDYVISKSVIGVFGGAGMIAAYLFGAVIAGLITGKAFDVNVGGLIMCLISKIFLMGIFCSLFLGIAVFFRNKLWLTIIFTFLFGMMLYPVASVAALNSTAITAIASLVAGAAGAVAIGAVSTLILKKRDLV